MEFLIKFQNYSEAVKFLLEQKETEWETFSKYIFIPELEKTLLELLEIETDVKNVNYILEKLWNEYKRNKHSSGEINKDKLFNILVMILEKRTFKEEFNKNQVFLLILVYIEGMKQNYPIYSHKLNKIFKENFSFFKNNKIISDILKNEGFELDLNQLLPQEIINKPLGSCFHNFFSNHHKLKVPTCWKLNDMNKCISLNEKNLVINYKTTESQDENIVCVKSNYPINEEFGIYYFEVEVINLNEQVMGIGLVTKDFSLSGKIPGWESNSIGYHSDDGHIFISSHTGYPYGKPFENNDIIGCCIDYINKVVFFTKNKEKLNCKDFYPESELYPSVGLRKNNQKVKGNFGEREFLFDIKQYINDVYYKLLEEVLNTNFINEDENEVNELELIKNYLNENGYHETLSELTKNDKNNITFVLHHRKELRNYIKSKSFEEAGTLISKKFGKECFSYWFIKLILHVINFTELIKKDKIGSLDYIRDNINPIINNVKNSKFSDEQQISLMNDLYDQAISLFGKPLKDEDIFRIVDKLDENFIYDIISKELFRNVAIDFEFLLKHSFLCIKEGMKINNPKLNFLMRYKNLLQEANENLYKNFKKYSN